MNVKPYTCAYHDAIASGSRPSAEAVVPLVLDLVRPRSVLDVGCGKGTWLDVFRRQGIHDYLGVDGAELDAGSLLIPADRFVRCDLRGPFRVGRQFDLVVSLEVAEHLPPECAAEFVDTLAVHGPVVLFSAAIPFQGGHNHMNEQWPDYWAHLFEARDYVPVDAIRPRIWGDCRVRPWFAQNTLLYVRRTCLDDYPRLREAQERTAPGQLALVHPATYLEAVSLTARGLLKRLPGAVVRAAQRRVRRLFVGSRQPGRSGS